MDVDRCLCKIDSYHYPTEAQTFDMKVTKLVDSFSAFLRVTIFAATDKESETCRKGAGITIIGQVSEFCIRCLINIQLNVFRKD